MKLENLILGLIIVLLVIVLISFNVHAPAAILGLLGFYAISKDVKKEDYSENYTETSDDPKAKGGMSSATLNTLKVYLDNFRETNFPFRFFDSANLAGNKGNQTTYARNETSKCHNITYNIIDIKQIIQNEMKNVLKSELANKAAHNNNIINGVLDVNGLVNSLFVYDEPDFGGVMTPGDPNIIFNTNSFIDTLEQSFKYYFNNRENSVLDIVKNKLYRNIQHTLNVKGNEIYEKLYNLHTHAGAVVANFDPLSVIKPHYRAMSVKLVNTVIANVKNAIDNLQTPPVGTVICDYCLKSKESNPQNILKHSAYITPVTVVHGGATHTFSKDFIMRSLVFLIPNSVNIYSYKDSTDIDMFLSYAPGPNGCPILKYCPFTYVDAAILNNHFTNFNSDDTKVLGIPGGLSSAAYMCARDILYMGSNEKYSLNYSNLIANFIEIAYDYNQEWGNLANMNTVISIDILYLYNYIDILYENDKYEIKNDPYLINIATMKQGKGFIKPSADFLRSNVLILLYKILAVIKLMVFDLNNIIQIMANHANPPLSNLISHIKNNINSGAINSDIFDKPSYIRHLDTLHANWDQIMRNVFNIKFHETAATNLISNRNIVNYNQLADYAGEDLSPVALLDSINAISQTLSDASSDMEDLLKQLSYAGVCFNNATVRTGPQVETINKNGVQIGDRHIVRSIYFNDIYGLLNEYIEEKDMTGVISAQYNNIILYDHKSHIKHRFEKCKIINADITYDNESLLYENKINLFNNDYSSDMNSTADLVYYLYGNFQNEVKDVQNQNTTNGTEDKFVDAAVNLLVDEKDMLTILNILCTYDDEEKKQARQGAFKNPLLDIIMILYKTGNWDTPSNNLANRPTPKYRRPLHRYLGVISKNNHVINYKNYIDNNLRSLNITDLISKLPLTNSIISKRVAPSKISSYASLATEIIDKIDSEIEVAIQFKSSVCSYLEELLNELMIYNNYKNYFDKLLNDYAISVNSNAFNFQKNKNIRFIKATAQPDTANPNNIHFPTLTKAVLDTTKNMLRQQECDRAPIETLLNNMANSYLKDRLILLQGKTILTPLTPGVDDGYKKEPKQWYGKIHHYFVGYDDLLLLSAYGFIHKKYKDQTYSVAGVAATDPGEDKYRKLILHSGDKFSDWFGYLMDPNVSTLNGTMNQLTPANITRLAAPNVTFDNATLTNASARLQNVLFHHGGNINRLFTDDRTNITNEFKVPVPHRHTYIDGDQVEQTSNANPRFINNYIGNRGNRPLCVKFQYHTHLKKINSITSVGLMAPYNHDPVVRSSLLGLHIVSLAHGNASLLLPSRIES
jgi:hypothetical protein